VLHLAASTLSVSLLVAASAADAGTVTGVCELRGPAGMPHAAVVWVDSLPERAERRLAEGPRRWFWQRRTPPRRLAEVRLRQSRFVPRVSVVAVGGGLVVRNADTVWHGVFSVTPGQAFELGKRAPGRADTLHFDRTGELSLRCDIHPEESGWVVVVPNHAFTRADAEGRWALSELPAGRYQLRAWWPDGRSAERTVDVPAKGSVRVRFARPATAL
jgi:hypothetical protein